MARTMHVGYSDHAKRQMGDRLITEGEVELVLSDHQIKYPDKSKPGVWNYVRWVKGRQLRISAQVSNDSQNFYVITTIVQGPGGKS